MKPNPNAAVRGLFDVPAEAITSPGTAAAFNGPSGNLTTPAPA